MPNWEPGAWEGGGSKILLILFHLSNFFTLVTFRGSQGLLQSLSYGKLVGCCLVTRGISTPQSCCLLFLRPSKSHPLISGLLGLVLRISGMEKRVSLFSLLFFSITKNYPRMSTGTCPAPQSTLVPAGMGWAQLKGGHPLLPSSTLCLQAEGRKGQSPGYCRDPWLFG